MEQNTALEEAQQKRLVDQPIKKNVNSQTACVVWYENNPETAVAADFKWSVNMEIVPPRLQDHTIGCFEHAMWV